MKKFYFIIAIALFAFAQASAQQVRGTVRGVVQDSVSATHLSDATVSLMRLSDSSLISFTLTGPGGDFEIKNIDAGVYHLITSFQGLQTKKLRFSITPEHTQVDVGVIKMDRLYKALDEVVVTDEAPVKVKGDTLAFNANAFKTKPNATVEDLLKKLPGVQVDRDGTVKAQGEQVQKIYVDGKEFFGNDPKLATKNLSADMIDEVEVFDDMSEQAKFNKIDDGSRTKAMNLKIKKDKKKGVFGRANAGYGTDNRYDAGINANVFKGVTQLSLIAKSNNINSTGFGVNDMFGVFGGGGGGFSGGPGGGGRMIMGGFGGPAPGGLNLGSTGSGLTTSSQAGLNYRDTWNKHFELSGSYFYNQTKTKNDRVSHKQTLFSDSTIFSDDYLNSRAQNDNHRFNLNMTYSIDSFNSLVFSPNVSFQNSRNFSDDTLTSISRKGSQEYLANESRNMTNSTGDGYNINSNLLWRRRFRRAGRTLSINLSNSLSESTRDRYSMINSKLFSAGGAKYYDRITNNLNTTSSSTHNYAVSASYTEPIARDKIMELNYMHSDNRSNSDRKTLDYNPNTGKFESLVDTLSNEFENQNLSDRLGANFRVVKKKYNYQLGVAVQQTTLESDNETKKTNIRQEYINFFPTASFNYQFQRSRSLRFNYRGRTNQPSISQLQDVTDVTNYPYIYRGNPALKQEFSNTLFLMYNFFDAVKFRNLFASFNFSNTMNKITNSREDLGGGIQLTTPVNINGAYNFSGNVNFGIPIQRLKGGNFNTTTRINYAKDASLINKRKNYTRNLNVGEDLRLNYNYKEKLDLGIMASINYNKVNYTLQPGNNSSYYTHSYSADVTYTFPKGFILSSDFDYTFNTGRTNGYNRNYALWNGYVAKQLFKSKKGELRASVFDILNQNTSVTRNIVDNYIEDVRNSTLQRYFMLTFVYNINRMGGKSMPGGNNMMRMR